MITPRQIRSRLGTLRWRIRITLWLFAAAAGLAVVGFTQLSELALQGFHMLVTDYPWLPLLLTPGLGMLVVWATLRWCPGAQGSGIPQVIAATRLAAQGRDIDALVSPRIAIGKVTLGSLALLGGFSAGREGPSVQVAASIVHLAHRFMPNARVMRPSDLLIAGGAAGIAAAFNTPLAGIVFAVEELGRRLETRTTGVLLGTIIIAGLVAIAVLGNYHYFGQLTPGALNYRIIGPVVLCGALCGVTGGVFGRLLLWPQRHAEWRVWRWRREHPVLFAGACGLGVAVIGLACGGISFGSGYSITAQAIEGQIGLPWYAPLVRALATVLSFFSGIPGGIFAPALAVGAGIGFDVSWLFAGTVDAHSIIALCMAGFLAAVTQSPITAAIIVMEMVDEHGMVISLMATTLIARAVSSRFGPVLYQRLALGYLMSSRGAERHY